MKKFATVFHAGRKFMEVNDSLYLRYPLKDSFLVHLLARIEDPRYRSIPIHPEEIDDLVDALLFMKGEIRRERGEYDLGAV